MPNQQVAEERSDSPIKEPELEIKNIQGNIMPGFNKDFQMLLFLKIVDVSKFKHWLGILTPSVTTTAQVLDFRCQLTKSAPPPSATWVNIAFSYTALQELGVLKDRDFADEAFRQGLWPRSCSLGDPTSPSSEGYQANWQVGGERNEAHIVIIVASDDAQSLSTEVARVRSTIDASGSGAQIIFEQAGAVLPGSLSGHEHFGFRDGVSQPGIRGLISKNPEGFLTPRQNPKNKNQGKPGQDLLWPGEFIFGYPGQDPNKEVEEPGANVHAGRGLEEWAKDGSFLVFRRLKQEVGAFHQFLHETAQRLNMDVGLFGAKCVGRWTSGAPILRAPDLDDAGLAQNDLRNNDFEFHEDDAKGQTCPFAGHIRKTYPRDDENQDENMNESTTQTHRLLRRGIPYGAPSCSSPHAPVSDGIDRGLVFLAYQTSIVEQFEFVQQFANDPNRKDKGTGHDPIIGQNAEGKTRERHFQVTFKDYTGKEQTQLVNTGEKDWVIPTGGGYFFAPSIEALKMLAS